jgi:hypothetical protein
MSQPLTSASQILDAEDLTHEDITIPEWGDLEARIAQLNAEETQAFTRDMSAQPAGDNNGMYLILIHALRTRQHERVLDMSHIDGLKKKNINVLNRLQQIALRVNGMGEIGREALKKDLSGAPTGVSATS